MAGHLRKVLADRFGGAAGMVLSAYWPIKGEPDLRGLMADLHDAGVIIALPVVEVRASPLVFRRWQPGLKMVRGDWDIPVPPTDAERLVPAISLAPVVGWDSVGYRLGYGGGYFDRTLASLAPRPFAIGIGLQAARLATIFPQPHDIPLNVILTEAGIQFQGSSSICVVQREHSGPEQVRAGSPIHRALQGLQSVDLAFGLTIAPLHFDRIPDRINVSVQGSGEPHDGR